MDPSVVPTEDLVDLGILLGHHHAFGLVAGRCSAAQAQGLRRLREEKIYLRLCPTWRDFCQQYLNMSGTRADDIIRLLDEFGPDYFDLAQFTRVSAETYRALAPAIENGVLKIDGEQIALTRENSRKVASAVSQIRRSITEKRPDSLSQTQRFARLDQLCIALAEEFEIIPANADLAHANLRRVVLRLAQSIDDLRARFGY
jgi:hypothetical protein